MTGKQVAPALVKPPRSVIHGPGRIQTADHFGGEGGIELAPSLIERHPHDDRGRRVEQLDHVSQFRREHAQPVAVLAPQQSRGAVGKPVGYNGATDLQ